MSAINLRKLGDVISRSADDGFQMTEPLLEVTDSCDILHSALFREVYHVIFQRSGLRSRRRLRDSFTARRIGDLAFRLTAVLEKLYLGFQLPEMRYANELFD